MSFTLPAGQHLITLGLSAIKTSFHRRHRSGTGSYTLDGHASADPALLVIVTAITKIAGSRSISTNSDDRDVVGDRSDASVICGLMYNHDRGVLQCGTITITILYYYYDVTVHLFSNERDHEAYTSGAAEECCGKEIVKNPKFSPHRRHLGLTRNTCCYNARWRIDCLSMCSRSNRRVISVIFVIQWFKCTR